MKAIRKCCLFLLMLILLGFLAFAFTVMFSRTAPLELPNFPISTQTAPSSPTSSDTSSETAE